MRNIFHSFCCGALLCGLSAFGANAPTAQRVTDDANVSPAIQEIVRMAEAGVDAATIQAYVESFRSTFKPQVDDILYMHRHQVPGPVITAMIKHQASAPAPAAAQTQAAPAQTYSSGAVAVQPVTPAYVAPAYVYAPAPRVYVSDWGYPWYGWPPVSLRFSFGHFPHFGFGYGGGFGHHHWHR